MDLILQDDQCRQLETFLVPAILVAEEDPQDHLVEVVEEDFQVVDPLEEIRTMDQVEPQEVVEDLLTHREVEEDLLDHLVEVEFPAQALLDQETLVEANLLDHLVDLVEETQLVSLQPEISNPYPSWPTEPCPSLIFLVLCIPSVQFR